MEGRDLRVSYSTGRGAGRGTATPVQIARAAQQLGTPVKIADVARKITDMGVRPEIEVFDTGHLWQARSLVDAGAIVDPVMVQLCMGIPWGAPPDLNTFMAMVNNVPESWTFSAFSIGRQQLPYVALAAIAGGNVRLASGLFCILSVANS